MFAVCLLIYTVWVYTFLCMCAYELCIHLHRLTLTVSLNTCKHHTKSWVCLCACKYATSMCIPPCMLLLVCTSVYSWMCVYVCLSDWLSDASFPPPSVSWPFLPVFVFSRWWDFNASQCRQVPSGYSLHWAVREADSGKEMSIMSLVVFKIEFSLTFRHSHF